MTKLLPLVLLAIGCSKDIKDAILPDDTSLPLVGTEALKFHGAVPENLIFLSIDTFRKDHFGSHSTKGLTPFLDTIVAQGVVLEDHTQCSNWTFGSTTCTLAGRNNIERGHLPRLNGVPETRPPVPEGTPFLASWLGDAGFFSVLVSANDWLSAKWGNAQGYTQALRPGGAATAVHKTATDAVVMASEAGNADRWFMHMHFMEPHASYAPPEANIVGQDLLEPWPTDLTDRPTHYDHRSEYPTLPPDQQALLEAHLRILYEAEIRTIDERLATIWDALEREGYLDNTLVVLWNDHGEQFWEHGDQTHAYRMYGEESDGFAVFWARNIVGGQWTGPTASIDLVPTVLDLFDLPMPEEVTGYPLGEAPTDRSRFGEAMARRGGINMIVKNGWKMQYQWNTAQVVVHDRNTDPLERVDLFDPTDPWQISLWEELRSQAEVMSTLVVGNGPFPVWPPDLP